jgi:hypothetical protein
METYPIRPRSMPAATFIAADLKHPRGCIRNAYTLIFRLGPLILSLLSRMPQYNQLCLSVPSPLCLFVFRRVLYPIPLCFPSAFVPSDQPTRVRARVSVDLTPNT